MLRHALTFMDRSLEATGTHERWQEIDDTCHLNGTARMGDSAYTSATNPHGETWEVKNLFVMDGSSFPSASGVNPMISIEAIAHHNATALATTA